MHIRGTWLATATAGLMAAACGNGVNTTFAAGEGNVQSERKAVNPAQVYEERSIAVPEGEGTATFRVSIALPIPWATYPQALLEFLKGSQSEAFRIASDRLWLIITTPTLVFPSWLSKTTWIGLTLRSLAFGVTLWCACRSLLTGRSRLFWLSAISLANFPFLLVMHYPSPRYIALGWDLCVCTALIYLFAKGNGDQKLISRSFK